MRKKSKLLCSMLVALSLLPAGCIVSPPIAPMLSEDKQLPCTQLETQLRELDQIDRDVRAQKNSPWLNALAIIVWSPILYFLHRDAAHALAEVEAKRTQLSAIAQEKSCFPSKAVAAPVQKDAL